MAPKAASFRVGKVRAYRRGKVWYLQLLRGGPATAAPGRPRSRPGPADGRPDQRPVGSGGAGGAELRADLDPRSTAALARPPRARPPIVPADHQPLPGGDRASAGLHPGGLSRPAGVGLPRPACRRFCPLSAWRPGCAQRTPACPQAETPRRGGQVHPGNLLHAVQLRPAASPSLALCREPVPHDRDQPIAVEDVRADRRFHATTRNTGFWRRATIGSSRSS